MDRKAMIRKMAGVSAQKPPRKVKFRGQNTQFGLHLGSSKPPYERSLKRKRPRLYG